MQYLKSRRKITLMYFKQCMKCKLSEWYSNKVMQRLDDREKLESIEIKFKLFTMKPLHAKWLMEVYEQMTAAIGREICLKGWVKRGTSEAIENGSNVTSTLDPFFDIVPIENEMRQDQLQSLHGSIETTYITDNLAYDSDCAWEDDDGNIFDVFNIDDDELLY